MNRPRSQRDPGPRWLRVPAKRTRCGVLTTPALGDERGFMIIEVMAAALVLLVGILGVLTMLDTANGATTRSLAREQGNTLARDVVERARQLSYKTLVAPTAAVTFRQALPDGPSTSAPDGSWTMTRRATDYTVSIKTCKVDETSDGIGRTDSSYCPRTGGTGGGGTGGGGGGSSIGVNIFGISVSATGNVVNLACSLLGPDPVLNNLLASTTGLLGRGVSVGVCPSGAQIVVDPNPDDLTRVSSTVSWTTSGHSQQVVQSTVVPNPAP